MKRGSPGILTLLLSLPVLFGLRLGNAAEERAVLAFVCRPDNDLYKVVSRSGIPLERYDTPEAALRHTPAAAGMLILAEGYPAKTTRISPAVLKKIQERKTRLYLEYPAALPGLSTGEAVTSRYERLVTSSDFAAPLPPLHILSANGLRWLSVYAPSPHIVAARVAGLDSALFGLPGERAPILFEFASGRILVSTTSLSHFVTARFAPKDGWKLLWEAILRWLAPVRYHWLVLVVLKTNLNCTLVTLGAETLTSS